MFANAPRMSDAEQFFIRLKASMDKLEKRVAFRDLSVSENRPRFYGWGTGIRMGYGRFICAIASIYDQGPQDGYRSSHLMDQQIPYFLIDVSSKCTQPVEKDDQSFFFVVNCVKIFDGANADCRRSSFVHSRAEHTSSTPKSIWLQRIANERQRWRQWWQTSRCSPDSEL